MKTSIQEAAERIHGGYIDPMIVEGILEFYEPLSLANLQRLLWEELHYLSTENPRDDDSADTANAIRIAMAVRRLSK